VIHAPPYTKEWSAAAVDSALERGDLKDWRELFAAVERNRDLAALVLRIASAHDLGGASVLAKALVQRAWPGLDLLQVPRS
jgi:hypothetical protein